MGAAPHGGIILASRARIPQDKYGNPSQHPIGYNDLIIFPQIGSLSLSTICLGFELQCLTVWSAARIPAYE